MQSAPTGPQSWKTGTIRYIHNIGAGVVNSDTPQEGFPYVNGPIFIEGYPIAKENASNTVIVIYAGGYGEGADDYDILVGLVNGTITSE